MPRLNIRCCCQPQKIFGTLDVPSISRHIVVMIVEEPRRSCSDGPGGVDFKEISQGPRYETIKLRDFIKPSGTEIAVYSDDRPIEFWRQFSSFKEGDMVLPCTSTDSLLPSK